MFTTKTIFEGFVGLHFLNGKIVKVLPRGKHRFWGSGHHILPMDLREKSELIGGQEVSTQDGGSLRVSLWVCYRIVDPDLFYSSGELTPLGNEHTFTSSSPKRIHLLVQTSLREWTSNRSFVEAYEQRGMLAAELLPQVAEKAKEFGIDVTSLSSLDVSMSGSLKAAYSDLLKTKIEGETALARARNESATMRNLLNTARLVREHPGLLELRVLSTGQKPKVTFFVGSQPPQAQSASIESEEE